MPESGHFLLPVLLILLSAGAMAYYQPRDQQDTLTGPESGAARSYLLPPSEDREYSDLSGWESAPDPRFYILTEPRQYDQDPANERRVKRNIRPSLSIANNMDVLRDRYMLEAARRRMRESQGQIMANRELLKSIGKRDDHHQSERLDVAEAMEDLRQRLLMEVKRQRMRPSQGQIMANRELLKSIGKRDVHQSRRSDADETGNTRTSRVTSLGWPSLSRSQQEKL